MSKRAACSVTTKICDLTSDLTTRVFSGAFVTIHPCLARLKAYLRAAIYIALSVSVPAFSHEGHGSGEAAPTNACTKVSIECARSATPTFGPDGQVWLVWSYGDVVYVSISTDGGATFPEVNSVTEKMSTLDDNSEARPRLSRLADGSLLLTVTQRDSHYQGRLFTARSIDGGHNFSTPQPMLTEAGQRFGTPLLLPTGRLLIAWLDLRNQKAAKARGENYKDTGVAVAWSDDNGQSFHGKSILADYSCDCCRMAGAVGPDGHAVFAWRHVFDGTTRDHAAARFNDDGSLGPLRRIAEDGWKIDACPMHGPSLSIGKEGTWHATWFTGVAGKSGLYYARSLDQGATFSAPQAIGNPANKPARPQVLAGAGQNVWRAWKEFDGHATTLQLQHSKDSGASWGNAMEVAKTHGASDHPQLLADGDSVYLSWLTREEGYRLTKLPAEGM